MTEAESRSTALINWGMPEDCQELPETRRRQEDSSLALPERVWLC